MTTIDTARLRALAEAATPGKRTVEGSRILVDFTLGAQTWGPNWRNDQAFITAADPATVIALLDEIERLRGEGEWEYGVHLGATDEVRAHTSRRLAVSDARGKSTTTYPDGRAEVFDRTLMRRRKAGPWEPVEGDGDA